MTLIDVIENMPMSDYLARPELGSGQVEEFRLSRQKFNSRYNLKTMARKPSTAAQILGSVVHVLAFEPETEAKQIVVIPDTAPDGKKWLRRKGSAHANAWKDLEWSADDSYLINAADLAKARTIASSVVNHTIVRKMLRANNSTETTVIWEDEATGLACKCRFDVVGNVACDLKTCENPAPAAFAKACANFGYHNKRAHYLDGIRAWKGDDTPAFVLIAAGTKEPTTDDKGRERYPVACYNLTDDNPDTQLSLGEVTRRRTLSQLAGCYESDDWREAWETSIIDLAIPRYAHFASEYEMEGETDD